MHGLHRGARSGPLISGLLVIAVMMWYLVLGGECNKLPADVKLKLGVTASKIYKVNVNSCNCGRFRGREHTHKAVGKPKAFIQVSPLSLGFVSVENLKPLF